MQTVHELSQMAGVSVRTLHYYDEIGLLRPAQVTDVGYRLYGEAEFLKLEQILFFKEIGFSLKEIKDILRRNDYNEKSELKKQREILIMQKNRTEKLIQIIDERLGGGSEMHFEAFDMKEIEAAQKNYQEEVKARWGKTDAYKESAEKTSHYEKADWSRVSGEGEAIFRAFAVHQTEPVSSQVVQDLVKKWQDHITKNFYQCTKEILAGLGQMYVLDERFANNINQYGEGLANYMSEAIAYYCEEK